MSCLPRHSFGFSDGGLICVQKSFTYFVLSKFRVFVIICFGILIHFIHMF